MIANGPTTVRAARSGDADAIRSIYNEAVANTTATMDTEPRWCPPRGSRRAHVASGVPPWVGNG